jgi:hypothetical protein
VSAHRERSEWISIDRDVVVNFPGWARLEPVDLAWDPACDLA